MAILIGIAAFIVVSVPVVVLYAAFVLYIQSTLAGY